MRVGDVFERGRSRRWRFVDRQRVPTDASIRGRTGSPHFLRFPRSSFPSFPFSSTDELALQKTDQSKSDILALLPSYRSAIHTVLSSPLTDATSTFDAARIKELTKLALAAVRITTAVSSPATTAVLWKADEFSTLAESYKSSDRFKGAVAIQNLLKQLVTLIGGPAPKTSTKRKTGDEPEKVEKKKSKKEKTVVEEVAAVEVMASPVVKEKKVKKEGKKGKREKKP